MQLGVVKALSNITRYWTQHRNDRDKTYIRVLPHKIRPKPRPHTRSYEDLFVGILSWWRHQMETFSALLALYAGNSPVPGEFPAQRPVTRSFDVFFDLRLNKRLSKQSWGWWFERLSRPLWRHRNVTGPLCGEFTGPRWIPRTKASDAELWCFLWSASE